MIAAAVAAIALATCAFNIAVKAATIAIDVGHYSEKPGATSARGRAELEFNRDLAADISAALDALGHGTLVIGADGIAKFGATRTDEAARNAYEPPGLNVDCRLARQLLSLLLVRYEV